MLIDCQIKPSRLRVGCFMAVNGVVLLLIIACSGISPAYKLMLSVAFTLFNLANVFMAYTGFLKPRVLHVWQVNRCEWYVQDTHHSQAVEAELLAIDFRGFTAYLCFKVQGRQRALVLWKDQLNQSEWRKLKVLSRLHQTPSHMVF